MHPTRRGVKSTRRRPTGPSPLTERRAGQRQTCTAKTHACVGWEHGGHTWAGYVLRKLTGGHVCGGTG